MVGKISVILKAINSFVLVGLLLLFIYTVFIYKHPKITESAERKKIESEVAVVKKDDVTTMINLDPITANLDPYTVDGKEKVHYVTITMSLEINDEDAKDLFEQVKPLILDRIISLIAKKKFEDLNQVQGRYIFRSQIIDNANEIIGAPIVTEVYFTDFLLQ